MTTNLSTLKILPYIYASFFVYVFTNIANLLVEI